MDGIYVLKGVFRGLGDVTVPAGNFEDCPTFEVGMFHGDGDYETWLLWYARDVGCVRREYRLVSAGEVRRRIVDELTVWE